jgi:small subunit ribosomal protein S17
VSETENENGNETTEPVEETAAGEPEAPTAPAAKAPETAAEEPAETEAEAVEAPEGTVPAGDSPPESAPAKRSRPQRHVPRRERRQRPKIRAKAEGVRNPITRAMRPDRERGRTQERRGVVVSNAMDKTIVVKVDVLKVHPRYKKVIRRSQKFHAHDERNQANVGDVVRIVETRPLSKTKNWRLAEVVEVAK